MTAAAPPLISWPQPLNELAGFVAIFLTTGAPALRYVVLGGFRRSGDPGERAVAAQAARHAAWWALGGAMLAVVIYALRLPDIAANHHQTVAALFSSDLNTQIVSGARLAALVGFLVAALDAAWGWPLATLGVLVGLLRLALFAQWLRLINPVHELAGGAWIGTLFLLLVAGMPAAMAQPAERRDALVARLIGAFSPLALTAAAVLATFGVATAWLHLKHPSALWTTPYGITLIVKLAVVASVALLGAWNWRRVKPRLGAAGATAALRASARTEVLLGGVVLLVTSVLVSLPSP